MKASFLNFKYLTESGCAIAVATILAVSTVAISANGVILSREFNRDGNVLIADQFNNRVIEITPAGEIVWSFGLGPEDFSARSPIGVNDAQRVGPFTLLAGTGTPAGVILQAPGGAVDNRVLLVDPAGQIVWQYGQFGQTGTSWDICSVPPFNAPGCRITTS